MNCNISLKIKPVFTGNIEDYMSSILESPEYCIVLPEAQKGHIRDDLFWQRPKPL